MNQISLHNDLASVINMAKAKLFSMDNNALNYTLPTSEMILLLTTLVAMNEGREMATKPWISQHLAAAEKIKADFKKVG